MGNLSITIFFYINKNEEPFFLALKKKKISISRNLNFKSGLLVANH